MLPILLCHSENSHPQVLNLIPCTKPLLLCEVIYSQTPRIRMWSSWWGDIILPTTVANTKGLSGLVDPQVLPELHHQPPCWRKGQGNPDLTPVVREGHKKLAPGSLWWRAPRGGSISCDSVTKVLHKASIRKRGPWSPTDRCGPSVRHCHRKPSSPVHPLPSLPCVYVFVCVFTHLGF